MIVGSGDLMFEPFLRSLVSRLPVVALSSFSVKANVSAAHSKGEKKSNPTFKHQRFSASVRLFILLISNISCVIVCATAKFEKDRELR